LIAERLFLTQKPPFGWDPNQLDGKKYLLDLGLSSLLGCDSLYLEDGRWAIEIEEYININNALRLDSEWI
jgi:hypothetical protein